MSGIPGPTPVAGRFPLSALRIGEGVAGSKSVGVWRVWVPDFGYSWNHLPGHADSATGVVSPLVSDAWRVGG